MQSLQCVKCGQYKNKTHQIKIPNKQFRVKLRYNTLSSLIEFKHITTLNLNIFEKDKTICVSLINATMCLNSIGESNVSNLRKCT